jgi:uncharacterized protein YqeY
MPTLRDTIDADIRTAMLEKNEIARDALRMVKSEMLLKEVEVGAPLDDAQVTEVLKRAIKTRRESIEQYVAGGRAESAAREQAEIDVVARYLPAEMSEADTRAAIEAIVRELGLSGKKDMGRLMKELKARHPSVDGKTASQLAGSALG